MSDPLIDSLAHLKTELTDQDRAQLGETLITALYRLLPGGSSFEALCLDYPDRQQLNRALRQLASSIQDVRAAQLSEEERYGQMQSGILVYLRTVNDAVTRFVDITRADHAEIMSILSAAVQVRMPAQPILFLVSGPSAAGKDCLLAQVVPELRALGYPCRFVVKLTTRSPRASGADTESYYRYEPEPEFSAQVRAGEVLFPYSKYGYRYGFSRSDIDTSSANNSALFAIYSEFQQMQQTIAQLRMQGVVVEPILVYATGENCARRMPHRNLGTAEMRQRSDEARADCRYIQAHLSDMNRLYSLALGNSDGTSFESSAADLFRFMVQRLQGQKVKRAPLSVEAAHTGRW